MTDTATPGVMIPIEEAAKALKTTELNVLMHIKRGLLDGVETEDGWQVPLAGLQALLAGGVVPRGQVVCPPSCGQGGGCSSCK